LEKFTVQQNQRQTVPNTAKTAFPLLGIRMSYSAIHSSLAPAGGSAKTTHPFSDYVLHSSLKDKLRELTAKYNIKTIFTYSSPPSVLPPSEFYDEFFLISANARKELKEAYPDIHPTFKRTYKNWVGPTPSSEEYGFDIWFSDEIRPYPHGGYPGAQYAWETSPPGLMLAHLSAFQKAYRIFEEKKQEKKQEKERTQKPCAFGASCLAPSSCPYNHPKQSMNSYSIVPRLRPVDPRGANSPSVSKTTQVASGGGVHQLRPTPQRPPQPRLAHPSVATGGGNPVVVQEEDPSPP
jgi:hypothetical protein